MTEGEWILKRENDKLVRLTYMFTLNKNPTGTWKGARHHYS